MAVKPLTKEDVELLRAIVAGDADRVAKALDAGARVNHPIHSDEGSLLVAARTGNVNVVRLLLDRGAKVDGTHGRKRTALYALLEDLKKNASPEVIELLLERGANPSHLPTPNAIPMVHLAVKFPARVMRALLRAGADPDVRREKRGGATALHYAHDPEIVAVLLEGGASPEPEGSREVTPMWLYFQDALGREERYITLVRLLLDAGASPDKRPTNDDRTVVVMASLRKYEKLTHMLLDAGASAELPNASLITAAALVGMTSVVERVLAEGGNPDFWSDNEGRTALHAAATNGHLEVAKILLDAGADPHKRDSGGRLALELARKPAVRTLLEERMKTKT